MTPGKFKEILNLYLDQTIDSEELSLLKKEVSENPERRKLFEQYCWLHQASRLVLAKRRYRFLPYAGLIAACLVLFVSFIAMNPWGQEENLSNRKIPPKISAVTSGKNAEILTVQESGTDFFRTNPFLKERDDFHFALDQFPSRFWNRGLEDMIIELELQMQLQKPETIFFTSETPNRGATFLEFESSLVTLPER